MKKSFISSNSFKVRAKVSAGIVLAVILGAITPNACGLRVIYIIAAAISVCEVDALIQFDEATPRLIARSIFTQVLLGLSIAVVIAIPRTLLIIGIALTMASDTSAYMVGKICGTKLIHTRPFATVSPNKSWEGVIGGIIIPGIAAPILSYFFRNSLPNRLPFAIGCLAGFCAIVGDVSESALKRSYNVKDANDVLKEKPFFRHAEALLGGSEGHGGYYDRLDSMSMVLLVWGSVTALFMFLTSSGS